MGRDALRACEARATLEGHAYGASRLPKQPKTTVLQSIYKRNCIFFLFAFFFFKDIRNCFSYRVFVGRNSFSQRGYKVDGGSIMRN